jgi:hypothetical protein
MCVTSIPQRTKRGLKGWSGLVLLAAALSRSVLSDIEVRHVAQSRGKFGLLRANILLENRHRPPIE